MYLVLERAITRISFVDESLNVFHFGAIREKEPHAGLYESFLQELSDVVFLFYKREIEIYIHGILWTACRSRQLNRLLKRVQILQVLDCGMFNVPQYIVPFFHC